MSKKNVETIWQTRWIESSIDQYKKITNKKHKELVIGSVQRHLHLEGFQLQLETKYSIFIQYERFLETKYYTKNKIERLKKDLISFLVS